MQEGRESDLAANWKIYQILEYHKTMIFWIEPLLSLPVLNFSKKHPILEHCFHHQACMNPYDFDCFGPCLYSVLVLVFIHASWYLMQWICVGGFCLTTKWFDFMCQRLLFSLIPKHMLNCCKDLCCETWRLSKFDKWKPFNEYVFYLHVAQFFGAN